MDFNATIDLIIRDLEDAREIIDDLKKYPGVPALQVEFAKSKCKSAAEIIALLKNMDIRVQAKLEQVKASQTSEVKQEPSDQVESRKDDAPKEVFEKYEVRKNEDEHGFKKNEREAEVKKTEVEFEIKGNEAEPGVIENKVEPHIIKTEVIKSEIVTSEAINPEEIRDENFHKPETGLIKEKETKKIVVKSSRSIILADRFSHLNRLNEDVSAIHKKPLFEAIGINDSFFFIREIFDGDKVAYTEAILKLDKSENLADAKAIIMSYSGKNDENEAVLQLLDLVKRKLHLHE